MADADPSTGADSRGPPPWPVNDLERLLEAAAKDRACESEFIAALLEADLFLVGEMNDAGVPDAPGQRTAKPGEKIGLLVHTDEQGNPFIPCFTSQVRLSGALPAPAGFIGLRGRDLFAMVRDKRLILNPWGPYGKELLPEETAAMLSPRSGQVSLPAGTQILLGQLASPPTDLIEQLRNALKTDRRCNAGYLGGVTFDASRPPHPLIGLDCGEYFQAVRGGMDAILSSWAVGGRTLDVVDMSQSGTMQDYLRRSVRPFYRRSLVSRLLG